MARQQFLLDISTLIRVCLPFKLLFYQTRINAIINHFYIIGTGYIVTTYTHTQHNFIDVRGRVFAPVSACNVSGNPNRVFEKDHLVLRKRELSQWGIKCLCNGWPCNLFLELSLRTFGASHIPTIGASHIWDARIPRNFLEKRYASHIWDARLIKSPSFALLLLRPRWSLCSILCTVCCAHLGLATIGSFFIFLILCAHTTHPPDGE